MEPTRIPFASFLPTAFDGGNYTTDDVIAFLLPLFRQVSGLHETGLVAPFGREDVLLLQDHFLWLDPVGAHAPSLAPYRVQQPVYTAGYRCYEEIAGHHDPQTDIFCLGLLLGSMALGLNLYEEEDRRTFIRLRLNPSMHHPSIHPTLGRLVTEMTELDRARRSQDLYEVIRRLEHYRDYDPGRDPEQAAGWVQQDLSKRNDLILNKLRNRLFDTSRRNRLLYYKSNMRFVNLTIGSVPVVLHAHSIRPELLLTWNEELADAIRKMKEIVLNKYLRLDDHVYLAAGLDRVRVESRRAVQEYGFSQLKLVISFLHWHNLKEDIKERIHSPLLLVPVEIKKVRKVKEDLYVLKVLDNAAEVNPVLASQLKDLYGIRLPDFIDLEETDPSAFYGQVKAQIDGANQGVVLHYKGQPDITALRAEAERVISSYAKKMGIAPGGAPAVDGGTDRTGGAPVAAAPAMEVSPAEVSPVADDPYSWSFDVCHLVLGNFNYKKMSLVRDYNQVIDQQLQHHVFDVLFSDQPRIFTRHSFDLNRQDDWFHVVTADPAQTRAILQSRAGYSYIIQGPPGTGKSQTITNLIADFVARGKNILFVCEKRAALDVVYHRLKQVGLEELCCYIHDSQGDKREFIRNLRTTYENATGQRTDLTAIRMQRQSQLEKMSKALAVLREFHATGTSLVKEADDMDVRQLIERIIVLRQELTDLSPGEEEMLPSYQEWMASTVVVNGLMEVLEEAGWEPVFAGHPFSRIRGELFLLENPYQTLSTLLEQALGLLDEIGDVVRDMGIPPVHAAGVEQLKSLIQFAVLLYPLARTGNLDLADPDQPSTREFERQVRLYRQQQASYRQAQQQTGGWKHKFNGQELENALTLAARQEGRVFGFLNGRWQRLKKQLEQDYDFSQHSIKPSYRSILEPLQAEYRSAEELDHTRRQLQELYRLDNIDTAWLSIDLLHQKKGHPQLDYLLRYSDRTVVVERLQALHPSFSRLETVLSKCLEESDQGSFTTIRDMLQNIELNIEGFRDWLPALRNMMGLPAAVRQTLRKLSLRPPQVEAAIAHRALKELYQGNRAYANISAASLEKAVQQLGDGYKSLQRLNAEYIRAFVRQRFLHQIDLSNMAASQLNEEQKQFKRTYSEGRKILENEFCKSMRYKSIRELSARESGQVLRDIKPVWLMSPYSVSDSLPLDPEHFDVVIFDEASQITLEEGVPALYRSSQAIIVGDQKQMPPTDFFHSRMEDPDDLERMQDNGEGWSDDVDSLLAQGARQMDHALLSWHYRSHYETLISYSNHAFYEGALLTIPDKTIHHQPKAPIHISGPEEAAGQADSLFDRSISFHFHTGSVYERRSNRSEAAYIARLVRELFRRNTRESIGIVAFSQEQQRVIEDALDELAEQDSVFAQQLEDAYNRTEDDQFTGLIVKNLENIQGDERDIIIMSVCYGPDARGKVLMNFGPVNKRGGEKRLNVLFSRAKRHMAVISSIRYEQITNEYNEGANYLRRFLQYAEMISLGKTGQARAVLDSLVIEKDGAVTGASSSVVRRQIMEQLRLLGHEVEEQVGQSGFKCSLAIKARPEDEEYTLGILIDDEQHYRNENLVEQYYQRPDILEDFGWRVLPVFAKDWLHQPQKVMEQIMALLHKERVPREGDSWQAFAPLSAAGVVGLDEKPETVRKGPYDHLPFRRLQQDASFWEAATDGNKLIVRWGRAGARGQTQLKTFPDEDAARKEMEKQIREKVAKGYRSV